MNKSWIFALSLVGCVAGKAPLTDDFSGLDGKSDKFSKSMTVVGDLAYGQTSAPTDYTSSPKYRAFTFSGAAGDKVDAWVRATPSGSADAVGWLLDDKFKVVTSNDDASSDNYDSHLKATLKRNATHYLVFREYSSADSTFTVSLDRMGSSATPPPPTPAAWRSGLPTGAVYLTVRFGYGPTQPLQCSARACGGGQCDNLTGTEATIITIEGNNPGALTANHKVDNLGPPFTVPIDDAGSFSASSQFDSISGTLGGNTMTLHYSGVTYAGTGSESESCSGTSNF